jgi:hypothetical protein
VVFITAVSHGSCASLVSIRHGDGMATVMMMDLILTLRGYGFSW